MQFETVTTFKLWLSNYEYVIYKLSNINNTWLQNKEECKVFCCIFLSGSLSYHLGRHASLHMYFFFFLFSAVSRWQETLSINSVDCWISKGNLDSSENSLQPCLHTKILNVLYKVLLLQCCCCFVLFFVDRAAFNKLVHTKALKKQFNNWLWLLTSSWFFNNLFKFSLHN